MNEDTALREARDKSYFMRRAAQERSAANRAGDEKAREAHQELAKRYRGLVKTTRERESTRV